MTPEVGERAQAASQTPEVGHGTSDWSVWRPTFGAIREAGGTTFRVWASAARSRGGEAGSDGRSPPAR